MDERGANIDIVFRNGLKEYEVLPPTEVWDNIQPKIRRKKGPFVLIKAAALIGIVVAMSFFAYRLSQESSAGLDSSGLALNEEVAPPAVISSIPASPVKAGTQKIKRENLTAKNLSADVSGEISEPLKEAAESYPEITYVQGPNSISVSGHGSLNTMVIPSLNSGRNKSIGINPPELKYVPDDLKSNSVDRWSIAAMASPTFYSSFGIGKDDISKQLMAAEQPVISYSGGIAFSYKINKRFTIQSGLYYSSQGQQVDGISSFAGFRPYDNTKGDHNFEVLTPTGKVYTNNSDVFLMANGQGNRIITNFTSDVFDPEKASLQYINNTLRQNFSYLELPVFVKYKFIDKTLDFNLIGGISYNLLINNSVYTLEGGNKYPIGKTEGLNQLSLSSSLGMGMEYNFSNKLSINLEPTFRYYLNPFSEITVPRGHPYSFGIFSGISYKF